MNTQPIEKRITSDGLNLDVHDVFLTIQGEGPFSGERAVFVRLAGCNLQCPGCDTDYTTARVQMLTGDVVLQVIDQAPDPILVVITGGEPFRQNITPLVETLLTLGYRVQIETNGSLSPSPNFPARAIIVCSPKTGSVDKVIADRADCFKYVLHEDAVNLEDGLPIRALDHSCKPYVHRTTRDVPVYLQPMDSVNLAQNARNLQVTVESCMKYGYILQLQIHKIIGVE